MEDHRDIIGLSDLLEEVSHDADELRKKHPSDYNIKNITMWWELEKERLIARHNPGTVVKRLRRVQGFKRTMVWFFAGWLTMICLQATTRLLFG